MQLPVSLHHKSTVLITLHKMLSMYLKRLSLVNLFILLFSMSLFAQNKFNYAAAWKKVDDLVAKKGLTESALSLSLIHI